MAIPHVKVSRGQGQCESFICCDCLTSEFLVVRFSTFAYMHYVMCVGPVGYCTIFLSQCWIQFMCKQCCLEILHYCFDILYYLLHDIAFLEFYVPPWYVLICFVIWHKFYKSPFMVSWCHANALYTWMFPLGFALLPLSLSLLL